ncbi:multidrug efflux SMR transporter [Viridibacillus sp. FSL R5-0477]|uniref:Multidrug resistance protein, SMR family n=1 Tax=Viridibacillus arenosi FSL R5-213 TaxID=1227360 RepID=W4EN12_9BACL|nr:MULTISPECIES: multidrug efflux SMR transporter [Viridibacillus]ETT81427.1 multidrug resistance protein, SMR family [Viridibacillus arenosi FSL R5-213]OMC77694.1 QacE family quaternary ammonium compound efflux SMR transporter [Viridibacillus sp. FSL H8-0123]OMC89629.1 QacE family quaternary ammonium compound efflux SMR transporter [Viridibacillus arenosi]
MHWIYLCLAIIFEVGGTTSMKLSEGFSRLYPSILMIVFYLGSFIFLTLSLKNLDVSVAYAIWSGVGIVIITLIGFFMFQEGLSTVKAVSIILILIGVVTLNMESKHSGSIEEISQIKENI